MFIAGANLLIVVRIAVAGDSLSGTMDIPQQQARELELTDFLLRGDSLDFCLPSPLGAASFRGAARGDTLSGSFEQGGYAGTFLLVRTASSTEVSRTEGEEITIQGADCLLAGTLTLPAGEPPFPCVLMLTGSGLQDRDEYVLGFPVFSEIAAQLVPSGIAVLRCDDRGVGGSQGDTESLSDSVLLADAGLMLDHLLGDPRIDSGRIGVLGHSEGSTIAFMLAAERPEDVALVVSMAGPAIDGYHLIPSQMERLFAMQGLSPEEIAGKLHAQRVIMDAVIAGGDLSVADSVLRAEIDAELESLSDEELAMVGDPAVYMEQAVAANMASIESPWFRSFLTNDPTQAVREAECPVLVVFGGLDMQVTAEANADPMRQALAANPDHEVLVIEGANHLFQKAETGSIEEYAFLEPEFIAGFPDTLCGWLSERL
jgi:pimeloyl-ACP methyl ester carboxylesterase